MHSIAMSLVVIKITRCWFFVSLCKAEAIYADVNFVTALVPSDTACLASSPGRISLTAVWISREVTVGFLLYRAKLAVSVAIFSKMSLMNEFRIDIALELMPVSGCTCRHIGSTVSPLLPQMNSV